MDSNLCDGNHSDSNVLLPPRKRLLAGFKKRNNDHNLGNPSTSNKKGVSDSRIDALMKHHLENPNLSLQEIVEISSSVANEAVNVAVAARARAEEKEVLAAKAMARAKSALDLVADITDEVNGQDRHLKKNKLKKHLPVKMFYNKNGNVENRDTDEELALRLHQAMNSSPRIVKNSVNPNLKTNTHKRMKGLSIVEGPKVSSNGHGVGESGSEETDSEDFTGEGRVVGVSGNTSKRKHNSLNMGNVEAESSHSKGKISESSDDFSGIVRKRGRMKQKKLPLSICSNRDLANNSEGIRSKGALMSEENIGKNKVTSSMWKCKAFKAPDCVKQNKVMEP